MKSLLADLFKQTLPNEEEFNAITIGLASPDKIRTLINIDECLAEGLATGTKAAIPTLASA